MGNFLKRLFNIMLLIRQSFSLMFYNVLRYVNIALVCVGIKKFHRVVANYKRTCTLANLDKYNGDVEFAGWICGLCYLLVLAPLLLMPLIMFLQALLLGFF